MERLSGRDGGESPDSPGVGQTLEMMRKISPLCIVKNRERLRLLAEFRDQGLDVRLRTGTAFDVAEDRVCLARGEEAAVPRPALRVRACLLRGNGRPGQSVPTPPCVLSGVHHVVGHHAGQTRREAFGKLQTMHRCSHRVGCPGLRLGVRATGGKRTRGAVHHAPEDLSTVTAHPGVPQELPCRSDSRKIVSRVQSLGGRPWVVRKSARRGSQLMAGLLGVVRPRQDKRNRHPSRQNDECGRTDGQPVLPETA